MALPRNRGWTPTEYLTFERASETRHELIAGDIYAMTGASRQHNLISANLTAALINRLHGQPCEVYVSDMRVKTSATGYSYPDVVVACGTPSFEDTHGDTLLNPVVIIEVLSPSTELYDRSAKFQQYRTLSSLQVYILVSQESPRIEMYTRQSGDLWVLSEVKDLTDILELWVISCALPLSEIYARVF